MRFVFGFVTALILGALAAFPLIISGAYNVAATVPDTGIERIILNTTMRDSVRARAGKESPRTWDEDQIKMGFRHYDGMCVTCHGAPGKERTEISKGLRPQPPNLAEAGKDWTNAQLFWIIKNGIRMTGMPAVGATHRDEQIWDIVGFVRRLPQISAQDYQTMEGQSGKSTELERDHNE
jgi:mono/diheme cytochrome c family protein